MLNKISDWIVAKPYRYWLSQWFLYSIMFLCSTFTVAIFFSWLSK